MSKRGLWGIERVQAVCVGGPFDGRQVDELGVLAPPPTVGGRFGWEHGGRWAMYRVTDEAAPDAGHSDTYIWRTIEAKVARFDGFEDITDDQCREIAGMRGEANGA